MWRSLALAFLYVGVAATPAAAEDTQIRAQFDVRMGPLLIGRGNMEARIRADAYTIGVNARVMGLVRVVAAGEGGASASGAIQSGRVSPASYEIANTAGSLTNAIRLGLRGNAVVSESVTPPTPPAPDRVPLTEASRRGVVDPLSAFVFPALGADPHDAANCNRVLKVYDGRQRYDITLSHARADTLRTANGTEHRVIVCRARYTAIAGHRRAATAATAASADEGYRDMEAWLLPVEGTRALILARMQVTSLVGRVVIQATRLEVTPPGSRTAAR